MSTHVHATPVDLRRSVEKWVAGGVISADQGEQILAAESVPAVPVPPVEARPAVATSLVTEALAYVGGVIILAAVSWLTSQYWSSMSTTARLALFGAIAVLLLVGGWSVPLRLGDVAVRLRSVLWVLSVGAFAAFAGLLAGDQLDWSEEHVALFVSATTLVYSALLWWRHDQPLQHVAAFIGVVATAATLTTLLPGGPDALPGAAICGVGLAWLSLSWGEVITYPALGMLLGPVAAVFGTLTTIGYDWGTVLTIAVLVLLVVAAVLVRSLPMLAVSALGALLTLPGMMSRYFEDSIAAPLVLVAVGVAMVGGAIWMARSNKETGSRRSRGIPLGSRRAGLVGAAVITLGFTAAIVVAGL